MFAAFDENVRRTIIIVFSLWCLFGAVISVALILLVRHLTHNNIDHPRNQPKRRCHAKTSVSQPTPSAAAHLVGFH